MQDPHEFVYRPTAERVARAMVLSGAYLIDTERWFTWKSGIQAPVYTDCRSLMAAPAAATMIKKALGSAVLSTFGSPDFVVGVAEAGIYWSSLVSDELHCAHAFVRKSAKQHGVGGLVVGVPASCENRDQRTAVFVDDLVASASSVVNAIDAFQEETRIRVTGVVSIVNWGFPAMRDAFRAMGLNPCSLVSYPDLLSSAVDEGVIDEEFCHELLRFYLNPRQHGWAPKYQRGGGNAEAAG